VNVSPLYSPTGWPAEPSHVFFGGDDGVILRDFTVTFTAIPEPTGASLIATVVVVGLAMSRRRRSA